MARHARPWERKGRGWYCWIAGRQVPLGKTRDEAYRAYHRLMAESGAAEVVPLSRLTVAHVLDIFLREYRGRDGSGIRPRTLEGYAEVARSFAARHGALPVSEAKAHHLARWLDSAGLARSTRAMRASVIKIAFGWAARMEFIPRNPFGDVVAGGMRRRAPSPEGAVEKLRAGILSPEFGEILDFMLSTGVRPGEARALEASGIAWEAGTAEVEGKRGRRVVVVPQAVLGRLRALAERHPEGPIFRNTRGEPWTEKAIQCQFQRCRARGGAGNIVAYHCRGIWATEAIRKGVNPLYVANLMGHSTPDLKMIHKHYHSPSPETLREAAEAAAPKATGSGDGAAPPPTARGRRG